MAKTAAPAPTTNKPDDVALAIQGTSFSFQIDAPLPRIIMSVEGPPKSGKTHFACTAPGPIAYMNLDTGFEVVHKFVTDKRIALANYYFNPPETVNKGNLQHIDAFAGTVWERFTRDYIAVLNSGKFRTVVIDEGKHMWDLIRMARFGTLGSAGRPRDVYGPVNREFTELLRRPFKLPVNLIVLHSVADEWVNDKKTGVLKRAGFGDIEAICQVSLRLKYTGPLTNGNGVETSPSRRTVEVLNCQLNPEVTGMTMENADFPLIASMVSPEFGPEVWE